MRWKMKKILRLLDKINKPKTAYAHCDVPCGVYEPDSMKWAAETVLKLNEKLLDKEWDGKKTLDERNFLIRAIKVKEEYAQICKEQILILWTDYFKPEHLAKHPELHDLVWKATKQCSTVKRTVSIEEAKKLQEMVAKIGKIFLETKK